MKFVPNSITRAIGRQSLVAQKQAPTLLFVGGVVGMIGSTVLACRATLQVEEKLHSMQVDLHTAREMKDVADDPSDARYSPQEYQKDVALIYARSVGELAKLYGPPVLLGAASIAMLTRSHNLLNERVAAVTAAYAAVDSAFTKYRERVIDKYGAEEDRQLRYSTEEVDIVDEDTGRIVTTTVIGPGEHSMYARFFDKMSANWNRDPEINLLFLHNQQNWFNDLLKARGHVFLNEVYEALDLDHTQAGSVVGWIVSTEGDNYIDFGIWDGNSQAARDFVNGREGAILLDFNVDGIIFDKIERRRDTRPWQS